MPLYHMSGTYFNLLGRPMSNLAAVVTPTISPGANSLFPITGIYDGKYGKPAVFSTAATDGYIHVDGNLMHNGDLETWSDTATPGTWTKTGTIARSTTSQAGMYAVELATNATLYADLYCVPGETITTAFYIRSVTGAGTVLANLQDLKTGKYWDPGTLTWTTAVNLTSTASTTYQSTSIQVVVDSYANIQDPTTILRLTFGSIGGAGLVDSCFVYPSIDMAVVVGHQYLEQRLVTTLRSSTDNFSASDTSEATMTHRHPAFYSRLSSPVHRRYWRLKFTGTMRTAVAIGELYIGKSVAFATAPSHPGIAPWQYEVEQPQIKTVSPSGVVTVANLTQHPGVSVSIPVRYNTAAELVTDLEGILQMSKYGELATIVVPDSSLTEVLFGRWEPRFAYSRVMSDRGDMYQGVLKLNQPPTISVGL